jgi:hypothetical protein
MFAKRLDAQIASAGTIRRICVDQDGNDSCAALLSRSTRLKVIRRAPGMQDCRSAIGGGNNAWRRLVPQSIAAEQGVSEE